MSLNKDQFKSVFDEFFNPLCNFIYRYVNDEKIAEDVVQDVFIKLWTKRNDIDIHTSMKSYLFNASKNKAVEYLRRQKLEIAYMDAQESKSVPPISENIEKEADKYMLKQLLYNSIRQLPPKTKEVFTLAKINGLTYAEIAEKLDISVKTVENQMGRALRLLREMLKGKSNF